MEINCWKMEYCDSNCESCVWYAHMMYFCEKAQIPKNRYYTPKLQQVNSPDFERYNNIKSNIIDFVKQHNNLDICVADKTNDLVEYGIKILLNYFSQTAEKEQYGMHGLFIDFPQYADKLKDNITLQNEEITQLKQDIDSVDLLVINNLLTNSSQFINDIMYRHISSRTNNKLTTIIVRDAYISQSSQNEHLIELLKPIKLSI